MANLLAQVDEDVRSLIERYEEREAADDQVTAGAGLYFFETRGF
jgi:hypothetical protein